MNSWQIIRAAFVSDTRPGTVGHYFELNRALDLYMKLRSILVDAAESTDALNAEPDVKKAVLARGALAELSVRLHCGAEQIAQRVPERRRNACSTCPRKNCCNEVYHADGSCRPDN